MIRLRRFAFLIFVVSALAAAGQPTLNHGDILLVQDRSFDEGFINPSSSIEVFQRDGVHKGTLVVALGRVFSDLFYRDGIIYVAARYPDAIERYDSRGNLLAPFTTSVVDINYLSPGPNGGVLAGNVRALYQFAADGSLIRFRDHTTIPQASGGIDLAADGCTVFYVSFSRIAKWNACLDTPGEFVTPVVGSAPRALRVLFDGTFLIGLGAGGGPVHLDAAGRFIRGYDSLSPEIALDIDGTSFWAAGCPTRFDIETGVIYSQTCPSLYRHIAVVGEPRGGLPAQAASATIPTLSPLILLLLAGALASLALVKMTVR